jgi:hypothetical protein
MLLVVVNDLQIHLYPETEYTFNILKEKKDSIYLYNINPESGVLSGFGVGLLKKERRHYISFDSICLKWRY